jgi:hypothetical protein
MPQKPLSSLIILKKMSNRNSNAHGTDRNVAVTPVRPDDLVFRNPDMDNYVIYLIQNLTPEQDLHLNQNIFDTPPNRMCASWISLLPKIVNSSKDPSKILFPMIQATASAVSGISHTASNSVTSSYTSTLRKFREALDPQQCVPHNELLVAGMCLAFVEVITFSKSHTPHGADLFERHYLQLRRLDGPYMHEASASSLGNKTRPTIVLV